MGKEHAGQLLMLTRYKGRSVTMTLKVHKEDQVTLCTRQTTALQLCS